MKPRAVQTVFYILCKALRSTRDLDWKETENESQLSLTSKSHPIIVWSKTLARKPQNKITTAQLAASGPHPASLSSCTSAPPLHHPSAFVPQVLFLLVPLPCVRNICLHPPLLLPHPPADPSNSTGQAAGQPIPIYQSGLSFSATSSHFSLISLAKTPSAGEAARKRHPRVLWVESKLVPSFWRAIWQPLLKGKRTVWLAICHFWGLPSSCISFLCLGNSHLPLPSED